MNSHLEEILKLSPDERLQAVEVIWNSIADEAPQFSTEQEEEIKRRIKKIESGEMKFSSWKQVKERVKRQL